VGASQTEAVLLRLLGGPYYAPSLIPNHENAIPELSCVFAVVG